jgi:hypothetical protein
VKVKNFVPVVRLLVLVALVTASAGSPARAAELTVAPWEVFDARGFDPNRAQFSQLPYEHIDPMTGSLVLTFTDLVLPGNAGFDLRILRTYNSKIFRNFGGNPSGTLDEDTWAGVGWSLHMGRIPDPPFTDVPPPIEMADGSQHRLYTAIDASPCAGDPGVGGCFITRDFWIYNKNINVLRLPNGLKYTFGARLTLPSGQIYRYVTRIEDPFGNSITVNYMTGTSNPPDGIASIVQDLGGQTRTVTFTTDATHKAVRQMTFGSSTWTYTHAGTNSSGFSLLTSVAPPPSGSASWAYGYNTTVSPRYELTSLTSPHGGTVSYTLRDQSFRIGTTTGIVSRVVGTRTVTVPTNETWTYSYAQGAGQNESLIQGPCGTTRQSFRGIGVQTTPGCVWCIGTPLVRTTSEGGATLETETLAWEAGVLISNDVEHLGFNTDTGIRVPLLNLKTIDRGGAIYSTDLDYRTTNFNDYGRPETIDEDGELSRLTTLTYDYTFTPYIRDKVASEQVTVGGESFTKSYSYVNATGFRDAETIYGIQTTFGPTTRGNVASRSNANGHTTSFTYDWGVLRNTTTPEYGLTIERSINSSGTVAWEKRRSFTTNFSYDTRFRRTVVDPPLGNDIVTTYDNSGLDTSVTVTRGNSWTRTDLDGFGRPTGTENRVGVQTDVDHDACGRRTYESYPFSTSTSPTVANVGTRFQYDALGRLRRKTNGDNSFATFDPVSGIDMNIVDEEGRDSFQNWSAFGDPDDARLMGVTDNEGHAWAYSYNAVGSLTLVDPPGPSTPNRVWSYNAKNQLEFEIQPESGRVDYTYWPAGNVRTRNDAQFGAWTYTYDDNERVELIDRPVSAYDTSFGYDESDNRRSLVNGSVASTFGVDAANRVTSRTDVVTGPNGDRTFVTGFEYDGNDNLQWIDYPSPSPRRVTYTYDFANRIDVVSNGSTNLVDFTSYHPSGAPWSFNAANGLTHSFTYDTRQRPDILNAGGSSLLRLDYGYDDVGNVTSITETSRSGMNQTFTYYDNDQLWTANGPWGAGSFTYTAQGDRQNKTIAGASTNYAYGSTTNRLTGSTGAEVDTFGYDNNGNITSQTGRTYTPNVEDMIDVATVGSTQTTYRYDGDRLRKVATTGARTRFTIQGPTGQLLSEFAECPGGGVRKVRDYVYAGARLVADYNFEAPPTVSFQAASSSVTEPVGTSSASVALSTWDGCPIPSGVSVGYVGANGSATSPADYSVTGSGTLTFAANSANGAVAPVPFSIQNDTLVETNETFNLNLNNPQGVTLGATPSHQVTIMDDDGTVRLTASAASVPEAGGSVTLMAQLTTSNAANTSNAITFDYAAATGVGQTAGSGDYTAVSGLLTFDTGSAHNATRTVTVPITEDGVVECPETFGVTLSNLVGGLLGAPASAVVTILDNDLATVGVGIVGVTEGNSGTTPATFQVTLSQPPCGPANVSYATQDDSAVSGGTYPDYVATSGTLTFNPPTVTLPVSVPVVGDTVHEDFQQFRLNLSNPVNAVGTPVGWGNITDNDAPPVVSVSPGLVATNETDEGTQPYPFQVSVSGNLSEPGSTVNFNTLKGSADGGQDFVRTAGTVNFPPLSQAPQTFTVPVIGDSLDEPEEDFFVELATPGHATIGVGNARAVIWDNDPPAISSVELVPGAVVERDMPVGGVHWYRLGQKPYSSYEAVTDGTTGNGAGYYALGRYYGNDLQPMTSGSLPVGAGFSRSLRWQNNLFPGPAAGVTNQVLKVDLAGCGLACQAGRYRLRLYDTTYSVPRFNNGGGQVTVLTVQNTSPAIVAGSAYFWNDAGALLASVQFVTDPRAAFVLNTTTVPALAGQSGSITITNDGRYGVLTGKAVTADPVSGFTFDTLMETRK